MVPEEGLVMIESSVMALAIGWGWGQAVRFPLDPTVRRDLKGVDGVYVVTGELRECRAGCSTILYIGSGDLGDRPYRHALPLRTVVENPGNIKIRELVARKQPLEIRWVILPLKLARCLERALLEEFRRCHDDWPHANSKRVPPCNLIQEVHWDHLLELVDELARG